MTFANLVKEKRTNAAQLLSTHGLVKSYKALWIVKVSDKKILKKLLKGFWELKTNFIVVTSESFDVDKSNIVFISDNKFLDSGADFIICDDSMECVSGCLEKAITPITIEGNTVLSQFDPMKNQGNSYLYDSVNEWSIFATLIRYLENYKFSFDNKNLVKNIFES